MLLSKEKGSHCGCLFSRLVSVALVGCAAIFVVLLFVSSAREGISAADKAAQPPYQACGVKVGEVMQTSAIIWTRLTRNPERFNDGVRLTKGKEKKAKAAGEGGEEKAVDQPLPKGLTPDDLEGAAPGAPGEVRVVYKGSDAGGAKETAWMAVDRGRDFTRQFVLNDLKPNTEYVFRVECRAGARGPTGSTVEGHFKTAPAPDDPARVVFTVVTGQDYGDLDNPRGYKIYPVMLHVKPSFFVNTGDITYYDGSPPWATNIALAHYHWQRMYSLPNLVEFHRQVPSYFIKDDHDTWQDDCWPTMKNKKMGDFTFKQGQAIFLEQFPMGERTYRTIRWGKDLQIWLVEGRDFRSANSAPDGPNKTIWGAEQKAWFKRTVQESDATFRVLISPTPLVGPDRENKNDNHANKGFKHEGDELRRFIAGQKNMVIACGDRHWQYVSVDPETGAREYSCGPVSNEHAGGWRQDRREPPHRYLNVTGGFLAGTVERIGGKPTLTFDHYSVDGKVLNDDRLMAE